MFIMGPGGRYFHGKIYVSTKILKPGIQLSGNRAARQSEAM